MFKLQPITVTSSIPGFILGILIICFAFIPVLSRGQTGSDTQKLPDSDTTAQFNPLTEDIIQRIPSLEDLIDSAIVHSPLLKSQDADIEIWKYKIKTARREWMQNFYIDGMLQSDVWDGLTNNKTSYGDENSILSYQNNTRALGSVSLRIPMDDFWDRRNRVKTVIKEVEKSMAIKDNLILELRKTIILLYNQLIVNQRKLKISNENVITNSLQKEMAEKEFLNGQTTLYEVARINEMYRRAVYDFEDARIELYNSYSLLQEISGIKFNVINKID
ncbi:MAG: TolC family protein [Bacteroidales bacterium]|jgi:outer membrane protein TolC|nr:TolC family protein [Bacteroidales bacterium]